VGALLLANWKPLGLLALILGIAGYIWVLQAKVESRDRKIGVLTADVGTLQGDLKNAKAAIGVLDNGIRQYQSEVYRAMDSIRQTQVKIATQNLGFQKMLDNLALQAAAAGRIKDAPKVPFFLDNVVERRADLIGVRDGVYHFRLRRAEADHLDDRAVLSASLAR
jgi:hypothetical protein